MKEINQIDNMKIKETICNYAVNLMIEAGEATPDEIKDIRIEFGYLFSKEDGNLEGVIKVTLDGRIYFFSIQDNGMQYLNINEPVYLEVISKMVELHSCLRNNEMNILNDALDRKTKNNKYLTSLGITINDNLAGYNEDEVSLKKLEDICKRAIASLITIQIACDINNGDYEESIKYFKPMYKKYGVHKSLTEKEERIVNGTYTKQDAIDLDWQYEAYWALCWSLGLLEDIKDASVLCDCQKAINFVVNTKNLKDFMRKCKLRSKEEILDMQDLYLRYHWALNNKKVDENTLVGNLNASNVIERRRGLEWIISNVSDWDNLGLNA